MTIELSTLVRRGGTAATADGRPRDRRTGAVSLDRRTRAEVAPPRTLLGVWAHPDDEAFLSSGLILDARDRGDRVVVVTATRGELGTDDPAAWPPDRLGAHRARELAASLAVLGVTEHRWLGYTDGDCPNVPEGAAVDAVSAIIDETRPDTIVTFGSDGVTGHLDHRAVGAWTRRARRDARPGSTLLQAVLPPRFTSRFAEINDSFGIFMNSPAAHVRPDVHLRLRGERLDRKVAALRAQDSQAQRLVDGVGLRTFRRWWADEAFVVEPGSDALAA
ncbi:PIG-L deacetylase family protein [Pseudonocardia endophytica]|uniref:LmbE family N-acetylglucosaminyl deacetylase n=1 Tax=Pseudonocardia endophytica TaxID=401976 RepID=A0A4R1HK83_PSEEN|nr:PIG-L family deacetylase [Pseudonocardia endophytica]TCK22278.1 LmbE family N-acetylglucosaminyl deacetylase [Pseudonocardia endophytica]